MKIIERSGDYYLVDGEVDYGMCRKIFYRDKDRLILPENPTGRKFITLDRIDKEIVSIDHTNQMGPRNQSSIRNDKIFEYLSEDEREIIQKMREKAEKKARLISLKNQIEVLKNQYEELLMEIEG